MSRDFYDHAGVRIINADCREALRAMDAESVDCCITSPPYWALRDYGVDGQIGLEESHEAFERELVAVFREVRRVLRAEGVLWLNMGDSYVGGLAGGRGASSKINGTSHEHVQAAQRKLKRTHRTVPGLKPKDLIGQPWSLAFALRRAGWYLRCDIVWEKPTVMPESVTDRPTRSHEYVFLLSKSERYWYDAETVKEPTTGTAHRRSVYHKGKAGAANGGRVRANESFSSKIVEVVDRRNLRTVWRVQAEKFSGAHFAMFPTALVKPMVLAGCRPGGVVLDPFAGAGTTLLVAKELGRRAIGIELNPEYCAMAAERLKQDTLPLAGGAS